MRPVLVTSYVNPDLDGVACMIAYAEFLRKIGTHAEAGIIGEPHVEAHYMLDRFNIVHPPRIPSALGYDRIVLVDASDPHDLRGAIPLDRVIEVIDHRTVHDVAAFPNATTQIEPVGAAATLVGERFRQNKVPVSTDTAILLCGGIISNTRNLNAGVTTDRDRDAYDWLNGTAGLAADFWRELFEAKSDVSGHKLVQRIRGDFKRFVLGGKSVGIAELEMLGARAVVRDRLSEITGELESIKREQQLDIVFQNTLDLAESVTLLIADDETTQRLLEEAVGARFTGAVAQLPNLLMRKQVVPKLREVLGRR